jgi:hypothetical protein
MRSKMLICTMACTVLAAACHGDARPSNVQLGCGAGHCSSGLQVAVSGLLPAGAVIEARVGGELVGTVQLTEPVRDAGVAFFPGLVEREVHIRLHTAAAEYAWAFVPVYALSGAAGCTQCEVASVTMCLQRAPSRASVDRAS